MEEYFKYLTEKYLKEYVRLVVSDSHNRETMLAFFVACGADFNEAHEYVWKNSYKF